MAKKTTSKKDTTSIDEYNPSICKMRHEAMDKDISNIKDNAEKRHEEIKLMIGTLQDSIKVDIKTSNNNLKDKIVLTEKTIGDKIDSLSEFDDTLKGNGTPGIQEKIRTLGWKFNGMIGILTVMLILFIGGNIKGVTWRKIGAFFGWKIESKQIDGTYVNDIDGGILKIDEEGHIIIKSKEK